MISGNILVRVLGVERDRVKIGISAPGEITVLRQELWREGRARPTLRAEGREPPRIGVSICGNYEMAASLGGHLRYVIFTGLSALRQEPCEQEPAERGDGDGRQEGCVG